MTPVPGQRPPIHRVRTGCFPCRGRKKKCDEIKPICSGCRRNDLDCRWPTMTRPVRKRKRESRQARESATEASDSGRRSYQSPAPEPARPSVQEATQPQVLRLPTSMSSSSSLTRPGQLANNDRDADPVLAGDGNGEQDVNDASSDASDPLSIDNDAQDAPRDLAVAPFDPSRRSGFSLLPRALGPLQGGDTQSFELLSHYLSRTAISMGNGSTDVNPFISQIIPLSFSKPLILDLVLGQSAAHRAMGDASKLQVAQGYYSKSLGLLRGAIDEYVKGKEENPLWIVIGALIMCFTESAKGDLNGVIFDHINVVGPLLSGLVNRTDMLRDDLRNFIVEYYVYTAVISMISVDPTFGTTPFLNPDMELQARKLAESGYIGHLCGCWLQLLVLIPRIFEFGQRARGGGDCATVTFPTADDFMTFSALQAQILAFEPSSFAFPGTDVSLAGNIYKQALHVYLLTTLDGAQSHDSKVYAAIDECLQEAFRSLEQLFPEVRINTSLCWALVVLGSCVEDQVRRDELRSRIRTMFRVIGLGNIRATGVLLEEIWQLPRNERSPWTICRIMQDRQMWISFV